MKTSSYKRLSSKFAAARAAGLVPGRELNFLGFDGETYLATVMSRPNLGVVNVEYSVRGVGRISTSVAIDRLQPA